MVQNAIIQVVSGEMETMSLLVQQSANQSKEKQEKLSKDLQANKERLEKLEKTASEGQKEILGQMKSIVSSQVQIQEDLTKMSVFLEKLEGVPGSIDFVKRGMSFVQYATFNSLNIDDKIDALKNDFINFKDLPQSVGSSKDEFIRTLENLRDQIEVQKQLPRLFDSVDRMTQILLQNNMMGKDLANAFSKATQTGRAIMG
jgi:CRP-like cAMP-binding protein